MSNKINWSAFEAAEESGFKQLERGAYVCQIMSIHDNEEKQYIVVNFDIVQGEFKGHFAANLNADGSWAYDAREYRSYKADNYGFLKRWITVLERSNPGYSFKGTEGDFTKWVGLKFVGVFADQEIPRADDNGNPKVYVKLRDTRSIPALNEGKIKVPTDVKRLNDFEKGMFEKETGMEYGKAVAEAKPVEEEDLPF